MSMLGSAIERWREHREQAAALRALAFMGPAQAHSLAADMGLDIGELTYVQHKAASTGVLLDRILQARRLNRYEMSSREPAAMGEIENTCARCNNAERCERELDAGTAIAHSSEFCPNALMMAALSREFGETVSFEQD